VKNIFEIFTDKNGKITIKIQTNDGSTLTEYFEKPLSDVIVLTKFLNRQYYLKYPGPWKCIILDDNTQFSGNDLKSAIEDMLKYMEDRDNPYQEYFIGY
jgi:hypothetical protein